MADVAYESVVLSGTTPKNLAYRRIVDGTLVVASRTPDGLWGRWSGYIAEDVVYQEGVDYTVDYEAGTIARTSTSSIPDYAAHTNGETNGYHIVWASYSHGDSFYVAPPLGSKLPALRAKLHAGEPISLVVLGDSICNEGEAEVAAHSFWARFATLAANAGSTVTTTKKAVGGTTSAWLTTENLAANVVSDYDLAFIGWGINDCGDSISKAAYKASIAGAIAWFATNHPGTEIILVSPTRASTTTYPSQTLLDDYLAALNELAASNNKVWVLDALTRWDAHLSRKTYHDMLRNDVNHPTSFGHDVYVSALRAVFSDRFDQSKNTAVASHDGSLLHFVGAKLYADGALVKDFAGTFETTTVSTADIARYEVDGTSAIGVWVGFANGRCYVSSYKGLWRCDSTGLPTSASTWTRVMTWASQSYIAPWAGIARTLDGSLYFGSYNQATPEAKVYRSTNDGASFSLLVDMATIDASVRHVHYVTADDDGHLWVSTGDDNKNVYRSTVANPTTGAFDIIESGGSADGYMTILHDGDVTWLGTDNASGNAIMRIEGETHEAHELATPQDLMVFQFVKDDATGYLYALCRLSAGLPGRSTNSGPLVLVNRSGVYDDWEVLAYFAATDWTADALSLTQVGYRLYGGYTLLGSDQYGRSFVADRTLYDLWAAVESVFDTPEGADAGTATDVGDAPLAVSAIPEGVDAGFGHDSGEPIAITPADAALYDLWAAVESVYDVAPGVDGGLGTDTGSPAAVAPPAVSEVPSGTDTGVGTDLSLMTTNTHMRPGKVTITSRRPIISRIVRRRGFRRDS